MRKGSFSIRSPSCREQPHVLQLNKKQYCTQQDHRFNFLSSAICALQRAASITNCFGSYMTGSLTGKLSVQNVWTCNLMSSSQEWPPKFAATELCPRVGSGPLIAIWYWLILLKFTPPSSIKKNPKQPNNNTKSLIYKWPLKKMT